MITATTVAGDATALHKGFNLFTFPSAVAEDNHATALHKGFSGFTFPSAVAEVQRAQKCGPRIEESFCRGPLATARVSLTLASPVRGSEWGFGRFGATRQSRPY